jgi:hypothetical protein
MTEAATSPQISIFVVLMSGQLVPLNKFVAVWVVLAKEEILLHPSFFTPSLNPGGNKSVRPDYRINVYRALGMSRYLQYRN